jgi:protocatechuate 3,4-dioxygenase beta subunit
VQDNPDRGLSKEKHVSIKAMSPKRRQLMVAGMAGAAAPAVLAGALQNDTRGVAAAASLMDRLIVSGRLLGEDGAPVSGATIEIWPAGEREPRGSATTDGDGRFYTDLASARPDLRYRVSGQGRRASVKQLQLARAQLQRDEDGAWRATFGATLA